MDDISDVKQLLDKIKLDGDTSVSVSVLKQMKNIVNDDNIITYCYIYDLKCQLEQDLKFLQ